MKQKERNTQKRGSQRGQGFRTLLQKGAQYVGQNFLDSNGSRMPQTNAQKPKGFLGGFGNIIGQVANVVGKVAPGPMGLIAKTAGNIFNDPEWWQDPKSTGLTTNLPLTNGKVEGLQPYWQIRPFHASFTTDLATSSDPLAVCNPSDNMVSTYLVQEIRKVMNVVPLATNAEYKTAFSAMVALVAVRHTLAKWRWEVQNARPFMPTFTTSAAFELFTSEKFATLTASIALVEETIRARVRLPVTMLEYLAWRFGRVFRTNDSEKAAYITYDVFPRSISATALSSVIGNLTTTITTAATAAADIFNAYYTHEQFMDFPEITQGVYDRKEFVLRANADIGLGMSNITKDMFVMDSGLDNPTTFTASTVSTAYKLSTKPLFPIHTCLAYMYETTAAVLPEGYTHMGTGPIAYISLEGTAIPVDFSGTIANSSNTRSFLSRVLTCKALDIYNVGLLAKIGTSTFAYDMTCLSIDAGYVDDVMIETTQQYAFANLVRASRKSRTAELAAQAKTAVAAITPQIEALMPQA